MSLRTDAIVEWLRQRMTLAGARGFVFGLSGGLDSAVVARLCQAAAPSTVIGLILPCHSDPRDEADAMTVAGHFRIPTVRLDLASVFDELTAGLDAALAQLPAEQFPAAQTVEIALRLPRANIKARLRMASLYYVANRMNYMVAGSGNRSELSIGYFTKHGDGGVDLLPIGELLKSEVRASARDLGVPAAIIEKAPSAGLWAGQTDEAEMGFTYAELENYLNKGADAVPPALAMRIERLIRTSEHKRTLAPTPGAKP